MAKWHGTVVDGTVQSQMARAEPLLLAGRVDAGVQCLLLFGCSPALLALMTTSDPPLTVSLPATWTLSTLLPMPILRTAAGQLKRFLGSCAHAASQRPRVSKLCSYELKLLY